MYAFLLNFNSNTYDLTLLLQRDTYIMLQNLRDLDFERSMLLNVKCDGVVGLPICYFQLAFNSKTV